MSNQKQLARTEIKHWVKLCKEKKELSIINLNKHLGARKILIKDETVFFIIVR
ncbi:50S ribosomal protein L23 chloroplastic [Bienertia sinuspersici]